MSCIIQQSQHDHLFQLPPVSLIVDKIKLKISPTPITQPWLLTPPTTPIEEELSSSSLTDLIPIAAAKINQQQEDEATPSKLQQEITKVRDDIIHHRIKEKPLMRRYIKLAMSLPTDRNMNRTKNMARWLEHKLNLKKLTVEEIENIVEDLEERMREITTGED